mmetsp:Transcript_3635/g.9376  ORF Transcript_3635/g.9376 Transcript_3635/m.9376 type:complete len:221 (-) Transcript_3635:68-730(-)
MAQQAKLVFYHIPADGDEADTPNAYPVLKPGGAPTVREVRAKFPVPGIYHFRFKMKWGDSTSSAVWMDVPNEDSQVPTYDGKIVAKVTRVSWEASPQAVAAAERAAAAPPSPTVSVPGVGGDASLRQAAPLQAAAPRLQAVQHAPPPAAPQDALSFDDDAFGGGRASGPTALAAPELQGALGCMQDSLGFGTGPPNGVLAAHGLPAQHRSKQDDFDMLFS